MMHIEGTLVYDDYNEAIEIKEKGESLASIIERSLLNELNDEADYSKLDEYRGERKDRGCAFNEGVEASIFIPKVSFRAYFSDEKCSLEEAEYNQILMSIGALDVLQHWSGYSEWTILGYNVANFKLVSNDGGEHDLEKIFESYDGKYVHIIIEIIND